MEKEKIKILLIEDNITLAQNTSELLQLFGYEVVKIMDSGDYLLEILRDTQPDVVLIDIKLAGVKDGIALAEEIRSLHDLPIVFITSVHGKDVMEKLKNLNPEGYLCKPFNADTLVSNIELALVKFSKKLPFHRLERRNGMELGTELYIRDKGWLRKISVKELDYIKTEGSYSHLSVNNKLYTLRNTIKEIMGKLPKSIFIRVHKSYVVNIKNIEALNSKEVLIRNEHIPIGRSYYPELYSMISKISD